MIVSLEKNDIFNIFVQKTDCGYCMLEPPRRGRSNECPQSMFWTKNKKKGIPRHTPAFLYKMGYKRVYFTPTCLPDGAIMCMMLFIYL